MNYSYAEDYKIVKVGYGRIDFDSLLKNIRDARLIYIGEDHDNRSHHETQLEIIKSLYETGYSLSIGLEMFTNRDQEILDKWITKKIDEKYFIEAFYKNWGTGWSLYKDIFYFARQNRIPLIGLNISREITRKVAEQGFQSLNREERDKLPPGITCDIDPVYMDLLMRIFDIKKYYNKNKTFRYFCEAQVLWDQSMAWYLNQYIMTNRDRKIIVLSGNIHSWKYGIPRQLDRFNRGISQKVILQGQRNEFKNITLNEADFLIIHQ